MVNRYAETLSSVVEKEVVEGTVISMNKREVVVNIGYKSIEFRYDPELKVGDKVEVYVETQEDKKGQLTLSHKKARALVAGIVLTQRWRTTKLSRVTLNVHEGRYDR